MRVALNLLYLLPGRVGGTETYARGLLGGLSELKSADEYLVFMNQESATWPLPCDGRFSRVLCPVNAARRSARYAYEQLKLPSMLSRYRVDIVHSLGYVAPLFPPCCSVATVHDVNFRAFGSRMSYPRRAALEFFVGGTVRRADRVIAVSEYAKREISSVFGRTSGVNVIYEGVPEDARHPTDEEFRFIAARHGIIPPYLIAFSSASPNKNIPRLIESFRLIENKCASYQLVIVGIRPEGFVAQRDSRIRITGYLDAQHVNALLSNAEFLVFPSLYEGFGLPVLEAMVRGVPVACSSAASLPEVAGGAALYFDPQSTKEIATAILRMIADRPLRVMLSERGRKNARNFSWKRAALETHDVYSEALAVAGGGDN